MEDGKQRSKKDDAERKEGYKKSDRERASERHRDKDREKDGEKSKDKEVERKDRDYRRLDKDRGLDKYKDSRDLRHRESRDREKESRSRHRDDREKIKDREEDTREKLREKIRDRDRDDPSKSDRKRRESERIRDSDSEEDWDRKRRKIEDSVRERDRNRVDRNRDDEDAGGSARIRDRERERHRDRHKDDEDGGRARSKDRGRERSRADRYRDEEEEGKGRKNVNGKRRKNEESDEEVHLKGKKDVAEEDMEEEQRRLDEEMEKRRRRVQEWQELKRKKEDSEKEKRGEDKAEPEAKAGKKWTLEGEESDDDDDGMAVTANEDVLESENEDALMAASEDKTLQDGRATKIDKSDASVEDEVDPLDAFMDTLVVPDMENLRGTAENSLSNNGNGIEAKGLGSKTKRTMKNNMGRIISGDDSDMDNEEGGDYDDDQVDDENDDEFMKRVKKTKVEKLSIVDHSKVQYAPFRKDFYREVRENSLMTPEEVVLYRKQLELKIRGKDVPKPVKTWNQTGLTRNVLEAIKKLGFEKPMSIQAQALPVIMSGRDCIGVAKTGSGKTLAFVLPMLRHIKDQPPLDTGDGPIGLIMAPTRELVQQIHSDIKKIAKVLGLTCVAVYGGSGVAQQISDLKRGTEIVVCTPGRMIDILCTSAGKITNLRRVTYLVMDEADRMFDMGFEPQITRIVQNTRPDRQTVLFSATFPRQVEILARKVLNRPVEIQVGGRSVVNKDITQSIELRPDGERFLRLLELLGEWYEKGKILVFVHSQEKCDSLFKDLLKHGYPCLSLHGGKDQTDRESTISDFKRNVCNLLIATSVAARGLDVKELELVINFDAPNHYEDYVHRVGRTGRAGRKGVAITFISEEERYAPDLVKALELSEQPIPEDLKKLADGFMAKVSEGTEHAHGTGYGGSGFKFNEEEEEARKAAKKAQAREYGFEEYDKSDSEDEDDGVRKAGGDISQAATIAQAAAMAAATKATMTSMPLSVPNPGALSTAGTTGTLPGETWVGGGPNVVGLPGTTGTPAIPGSGLPGAYSVPSDAAARVAALAAAMNLQHNLAKIQKDAMPEHYEAELEINDFPQNARWKVTHKETLGPISEWTGAAVTTRGQFYPPGKIPGPGERKLYLFIEGPTESSVKKAKAEVKRVLEDYTAQSLSLPGSVQPGRYSVL